MSTGIKRPRAMALKDAESFRELFADCFERWEIAGSVRRGKSEVGDVEHAILPKIVTVGGDGLFNEAKPVNAVCRGSNRTNGSTMPDLLTRQQRDEGVCPC